MRWEGFQYFPHWLIMERSGAWPDPGHRYIKNAPLLPFVFELSSKNHRGAKWLPPHTRAKVKWTMIYSPNFLHGAAIMENILVTRSEDSTLFREISREILRFVLAERPLAWDFAKFRAKCHGWTPPKCQNVIFEHKRFSTKSSFYWQIMADVKFKESIQIINLKPCLNTMQSTWPHTRWFCVRFHR